MASSKELRGIKISKKCFEKARHDAGLTQQALADLIGVSVTAVNRWAAGTPIQATNLQPLADALSVSVEYLKGEPERLTEAQSAVAKECQQMIARYSEDLRKALTDPGWAEQQLKASKPKRPAKGK